MPRRRVRPECIHPPAVLYRGGAFLDWGTHSVTSRPGPCRACGRPTVLTDCSGVRCHKVCAEREATSELTTSPAAAVPRPQARRRPAPIGGR